MDGLLGVAGVILFVHSVGNVITPTDFHSIIFFQRGWLNHQPVVSQWIIPENSLRLQRTSCCWALGDSNIMKPGWFHSGNMVIFHHGRNLFFRQMGRVNFTEEHGFIIFLCHDDDIRYDQYIICIYIYVYVLNQPLLILTLREISQWILVGSLEYENRIYPAWQWNMDCTRNPAFFRWFSIKKPPWMEFPHVFPWISHDFPVARGSRQDGLGGQFFLWGELPGRVVAVILQQHISIQSIHM